LRAQLGAARAGPARATNLGLPIHGGPTTPQGPSGTGTGTGTFTGTGERANLGTRLSTTRSHRGFDPLARADGVALAEKVRIEGRASLAHRSEAGPGLAGFSRGSWLPPPIAVCSCQRLTG